jgi:trigger factor
MKKKVLFIVISLSIMMLAWGCGKKNVAGELDAAADKNAAKTESKANDDSAANTEKDTKPTAAAQVTQAADTASKAPVKADYKLSDYITLGNYKGLTITYTKLEVTDADVDSTIKAGLTENATKEDVKDRPVQKGDTVNIDYEGLKDDVAFEGGTAKGYDLEVGSGSFIPGFEDALIGAKIGEKKKINLTFPKDYPSADLAGKAVVFNVTINSIKAPVIPELTEDYVKKNTEYDSVEAYKKATKTNLEEANAEKMKSEKIANLLDQVVKNSKISSYPQTLIDYYSYEMESYYTQYAQMYGYTLKDFLTANKMSEDEFNAQKKTYAEGRAAQELVLKSVIKAEGIELTDKEFKDGVARYAERSGAKSSEEFLKNAPEDQVRESLLWEKTINFMIDKSVIS